MKDTFIIRTEWYDAINELDVESKAIILDNLFLFHLGEEELINLNNLSVKIVWKLIEPNLIRNINSYDKRRDTSSINGKLGGRPPKDGNLNNLNKPNDKPKNNEKPIESLNVSVSVSDSVSDNDSDNKNIIVNDIEEIYKAYPSKCKFSNRNLSKSHKDKDKIKKLLRTKTKEQILFGIDNYIKSCEISKTYLKNFATYLNQLPEIVEIQPTIINEELTHVQYYDKDSFDPNRVETAHKSLFEQYQQQGKNVELIKYYKPYQPQ